MAESNLMNEEQDSIYTQPDYGYQQANLQQQNYPQVNYQQPFPYTDNNQYYYGQNGYQYPNYQQQPVYIPYTPEHSIRVIEWIGWLLLCSLLPIIGQIIMALCAKSESAKNYAKAQLIIFIIAIILCIIFYAGIVAFLASLFD